MAAEGPRVLSVSAERARQLGSHPTGLQEQAAAVMVAEAQELQTSVPQLISQGQSKLAGEVERAEIAAQVVTGLSGAAVAGPALRVRQVAQADQE